MENVVDKFLRYVKYDTKSKDDSIDFPSTESQLKFAKVLESELKSIGVSNVTLDKNGYVMGEIPSNIESKDCPAVGFISHMDTSPDMSGENISPKIIHNYDGHDIVLSESQNIILSPKEFKDLKSYIGEDLITTDGTTLLGADDKAGVSEIMTACEYILNHPKLRHGCIKIGFTPDEEVGRGADFFDVERFGAKFAYTVDGGAVGEIEYETFNAARASVVIHGKNIHPGSAKNIMVNSALVANELISMLPPNEIPAETEGREGFYHLCDIAGNIEETKLNFIIRDFDRKLFERRKAIIQNIIDTLNTKYNKCIEASINDQYYNMSEIIEKNMYTVDIAIKAIEKSGMAPKINPIRGGTDGSRLSFMGLPCPNLFTGGHNFHGKYEFIPVSSMIKAVETIKNIICITAEKYI